MRIVIRDASLAAVAAMAAERDAQVWLERVGDGDVGAVVIEDGTVRGGDFQEVPC